MSRDAEVMQAWTGLRSRIANEGYTDDVLCAVRRTMLTIGVGRGEAQTVSVHVLADVHQNARELWRQVCLRESRLEKLTGRDRDPARIIEIGARVSIVDLAHKLDVALRAVAPSVEPPSAQHILGLLQGWGLTDLSSVDDTIDYETAQTILVDYQHEVIAV